MAIELPVSVIPNKIILFLVSKSIIYNLIGSFSFKGYGIGR